MLGEIEQGIRGRGVGKDETNSKMKKQIIGLILLILVFFMFSFYAHACFFKSDCPDGYQCVTEKDTVRGSCQPDQNAPDKEKLLKSDVKCSWNMDCPVGNRCVKSPGSAQGICWENKTSADGKNDSGYKECMFNSDCDRGSVCQRPRGSLHGLCRETVFNNVDNTSRSPLFAVDKIGDKTLPKQCLMDVDCGLNFTCALNGKSVYGTCQAKPGTAP